MKRIAFLFLLLLPVLANGQMYFESGTSWTMENSPCDPRASNSFDKVYLEAENGAPLQMFKESPYITGKELVAEVKTEGEKVFFRYPGQENGEWLLMYDFGLQPGEGSDIYCPYFEPDSPLCKAYMQCEEIIAEDPDFDGMTTMVMSEPPSKVGFPTYRSKWIKGIGDTRGVIFNYSAGIDGIHTELVEVREGKRVVYKKSGTSVPESFTDAGLELRIEGNILTIISTPAERGSIYAIDGTEAASFTVTDAPVQISLPGKGIYVIKSGDSFRKILVK